MNPWSQIVWSDMHLRLIAYIRDALDEALPDDLVARAEEGVELLVASPETEQRGRIDVSVSEVEDWKLGRRPVWTPEDNPTLADRVAVPVLVTLPEVTPRWVEIRTAGGRLVTAIEVTSPGNKTHQGRAEFDEKLERLMQGGANVVEIDLIRGGMCARDARGGGNWPDTPCQVVVNRAFDPEVTAVYPCPLREALPVMRVPLRRGERDAALDLQELVDRCHARGRYWTLPYDADPDPALDAADLAWSRERLAAGVGQS